MDHTREVHWYHTALIVVAIYFGAAAAGYLITSALDLATCWIRGWSPP